ncbi:hypothetical protein EYF80_044200 [Liparis tanakae]|uniref:Uncharacterized protein n=1 Tax=Liparis tanakae TaxID=230148 RepID=A0A4Z2FWG0_9TELE|nr:hypothetical protein EYF80_044200 [Liparis tanakae]
MHSAEGWYECIQQPRRWVVWMLYDDDNGSLGHAGERLSETLPFPSKDRLTGIHQARFMCLTVNT